MYYYSCDNREINNKNYNLNKLKHALLQQITNICFKAYGSALLQV